MPCPLWRHAGALLAAAFLASCAHVVDDASSIEGWGPRGMNVNAQRAARDAAPECHDSHGDKVCGYNCAKDAHGIWLCGKNPYEACSAGLDGEVRCAPR